jgi:hypothetical protein
MIDVHAPHKSIGNASEFFLHLFTITIGLLIAVGIEAGVERYEHHELALEARQTMTAEIRHNAGTVDKALDDIDHEQQKTIQNLAYLQKIQITGKDAGNGNLDLGYTSVDLEDTAWRTAQATGALAFMPYTESERFSDIYSSEQLFIERQGQLSEDESQMLGVIRQFHMGDGAMTKDGANAMAREIGIFQGHLLALKIATRLLQNEQNAFLKGTKPSSHLSEQLTN